MKTLSKKGLELKQCLDTIKSKKRLLNGLQRQLTQAQANYGSISAVDYTKPKYKSSNDATSEERYVIHLDKIRNRINKLVDEIFTMEDKIAEEISILNECEQAMIIDRYIHGWSWKKICKEYNYCYTETGNSAQRIVNNALKKI